MNKAIITILICTILATAVPAQAVITLGIGGGTLQLSVSDGEDISVTHTGWTIQNCTIYNAKIDVDADVILYNVIIDNWGSNCLEVANGVEVTTTTCCITSSEAEAEADGGTVTTDASSMWEVDPKLRDPANDDFKLQGVSPCINAGTDVSLTLDYRNRTVPQNTLVDIGAYEGLRTILIRNDLLLKGFSP